MAMYVFVYYTHLYAHAFCFVNIASRSISSLGFYFKNMKHIMKFLAECTAYSFGGTKSKKNSHILKTAVRN